MLDTKNNKVINVSKKRFNNLKMLVKVLKTSYYRNKIRKNGLRLLSSNKDLFDRANVKDFLSNTKHKASFFYFSGGTTGQPKMIPLSIKEIYKRALYRANCYKKIGLKKRNKVAILLPFGPWVAGPSTYEAVKLIGSTAFPLGLLKDEHEIIALFSIIKKHQIDTIITTPSFMSMFIFLLEKNELKLKLEKVITSGEFMPDHIRDKIYNIIGAKSFSTYASSEAFIGYKCEFSRGYHYNPDYVKIDTNKDHALLFTVYDSDIVPIYRYSMGDLGRIKNISCECGTALPQVFLDGREKNVFNLSGAVTVFPYQIIESFKKMSVHIKECKVSIFDGDPGRDNIIFNIGTDKKMDQTSLKEIAQNLQNMSLDFSDVCAQGFIKFEVKNFKSSYRGTKILLSVDDQRSYER